MNRRISMGTTLAELLIAMMIFGLILTMAVALFVSGQQLSANGTSEVDVETSAQEAITRLIQEIQESDSQGVAINATHNAMIVISARNSSGNFLFYGGSSPS